MSKQLALFETPLFLPQGLRYVADFVPPEIEQQLVSGIRNLPLEPFQFGQFEGRRRVASFGFRYDYALRQLQRSEPIPAWLDEIVTKIEAFGGLDTRIQQVLARSMTSVSASAGTATSRILTGFSAFRLDPPVNCGSANLPASLGTGSRWMPIRARST